MSIKTAIYLVQLVAVAIFAVVVSTSSSRATPSSAVSFCFNSWPPYTFTNGEGVTGISVSIVQEAARRLGRTAVFRELPWKRRLQMVRAGEIDAVIDAAKRDEFLQGPASFSIFTDTFWVRAEEKIDSAVDLKSRKAGLVDGYKYSEPLIAYMNGLKLVPQYAVDDPANIKKLVFWRVDTVIADLASTLHFAKRHGLGIKPLLPPFSHDRLYLSFNKLAADTQNAFDQTIAILITSGYVDEVYELFLGRKYSDLTGALDVK